MASETLGARAGNPVMSTFLGALALATVAALTAAAPAAAKPTCGGEQATIVGKPKSETINGTAGDDVIRARAGNDVVNAGGGNDIVCGGVGDDEVDGGAGNDRVRTGNGSDSADGGDGDDEMRGQGGTDNATGGNGVDACRFEDYTECEADLRVGIDGPAQVLIGDPDPSVFTVDLRNNGPSTAQSARATVVLPDSFEFVGGSSDSRCVEAQPGQVSCAVGPMGADTATTLRIAVVDSDCPPPASRISARGGDEGGGGGQNVAMTASSADQGTNDHVAKNNTATSTTAVAIGPDCFPSQET